MSYEQKVVTQHTFPAVSVSSAAGVRGISRLPGKRYCRILDIQTCVTTAVVATSTPPKLSFGDGSDADKFALQTAAVDTAAIGACRNIRDADGRIAAYATSGNGYIDWDSDGASGALTTMVITPVVGTGGSVAGAYDANVILEWW